MQRDGPGHLRPVPSSVSATKRQFANVRSPPAPAGRGVCSWAWRAAKARTSGFRPGAPDRRRPRAEVAGRAQNFILQSREIRRSVARMPASQFRSEQPPEPVVDRWALWPALTSTTVVAGLLLLCGLPGMVSFVAIPISLLAFLVAAIALTGASVVLAAKKRPRAAASALIAALAPVLLWSPINWVADCAHLGLAIGFGADPASTKDRSGFAAYDWSVGLAGGPNRFLIYDESDEIARPLALHTHPPSSEDGFGEDCAGKVRHLLGHYYVCTF